MNASFVSNLVDDPCGVFSVGVMLLLIGHSASLGRDGLRRVGAALGGVALLVFFVVNFGKHSITTNLFLVAGFAGAFVGSAWILCVLVVVVRERLRWRTHGPETKANHHEPGRDTATEYEEREEREREQKAARDRAAQAEAAAVATAEHERNRTVVAKAKEHVEQFFQANPAIHDAYPRALLDAQLQVEVPAGATPEQAWKAARDLVAQLNALVAERRKQSAETKPAKKHIALSDLVNWYLAEKRRIEEAMPDDKTRADVLLQLGRRYDTLMKETLRDAMPS